MLHLNEPQCIWVSVFKPDPLLLRDTWNSWSGFRCCLEFLNQLLFERWNYNLSDNICTSLAMIAVDFRSLKQPVGILRILATILACISFSLVASVEYINNSYWSWCMFTWCFCFIVTFLIVIIEFTTLHTKAPFGWEDFTTAFAMLATLMFFAASIIYSVFFTCRGLAANGPQCHRQIGASVVSWVSMLVYAAEVFLTRLKPRGENIGFLSTIPGIMKMLETFIACIIFTSMEQSQYLKKPELEWCVSVYSLCFIFGIGIIAICTAQLTTYSPFSFEIVVIVYNIMAALMYISAMVLWPLYSFHNPKPPNCGFLCSWDKLVVITIMTIFNVIIYILDSAYSIYLVFFVGREWFFVLLQKGCHYWPGCQKWMKSVNN